MFGYIFSFENSYKPIYLSHNPVLVVLKLVTNLLNYFDLKKKKKVGFRKPREVYQCYLCPFSSHGLVINVLSQDQLSHPPDGDFSWHLLQHTASINMPKLIPGWSVSPFISHQPHCCLGATTLQIGHMKWNSVTKQARSTAASHTWQHCGSRSPPLTPPSSKSSQTEEGSNPSLAWAIEQTSPQTTRWMKLLLQLQQCQHMAAKTPKKRRSLNLKLRVWSFPLFTPQPSDLLAQAVTHIVLTFWCTVTES